MSAEVSGAAAESVSVGQVRYVIVIIDFRVIGSETHRELSEFRNSSVCVCFSVLRSRVMFKLMCLSAVLVLFVPSDFIQLLFDSYQTFQEPQTSNSGKSSQSVCVFSKYTDVNAAARVRLRFTSGSRWKTTGFIRSGCELQDYVCQVSFSLWHLTHCVLFLQSSN